MSFIEFECVIIFFVKLKNFKFVICRFWIFFFNLLYKDYEKMLVYELFCCKFKNDNKLCFYVILLSVV